MLNVLVLTRAQLITQLIKHSNMGNVEIRDVVSAIFDAPLHPNTVANYRHNLNLNKTAAEEA